MALLLVATLLAVVIVAPACVAVLVGGHPRGAKAVQSSGEDWTAHDEQEDTAMRTITCDICQLAILLTSDILASAALNQTD